MCTGIEMGGWVGGWSWVMSKICCRRMGTGIEMGTGIDDDDDDDNDDNDDVDDDDCLTCIHFLFPVNILI
jgi:hypothetical protein